MNGLPSNVDLSFILGAKVLQVAVGEFQTQVRLDNGTTISLECDLTLQGERKHGVEAGKGLLSIVGKAIVVVTVVGAGDVALTVDSGEQIVVHDSNDHFESYTIDGPKSSIVV